jgi:hypothetical protein
MRGAWDEDNTRSKLQRAKRLWVIRDWVDSIRLQSGDLEHLVLTQCGDRVTDRRSPVGVPGCVSSYTSFLPGQVV